MQDLKTVETAVLVDLLSQHTADYIKMLAGNYEVRQFEECKKIIILLQEEIQLRQKTSTNTTSSSTYITFSEDEKTPAIFPAEKTSNESTSPLAENKENKTL